MSLRFSFKKVSAAMVLLPTPTPPQKFITFKSFYYTKDAWPDTMRHQ